MAPGGAAGGDARSGDTPRVVLALWGTSQQPDLDLEEGLLLWAMKRHQGELRMFGGIWKKHSSGEILKGADQQFKLTPEELLVLERRTHPLTCEQDHIDPVIYSALDLSAAEPDRAPGSGAGGGDLLGER